LNQIEFLEVESDKYRFSKYFWHQDSTNVILKFKHSYFSSSKVDQLIINLSPSFLEVIGGLTGPIFARAPLVFEVQEGCTHQLEKNEIIIVLKKKSIRIMCGLLCFNRL